MSEAMKPQTIRFRDGAGYDHGHFTWNPLTERKLVAWPGGARIAWCLSLIHI